MQRRPAPASFRRKTLLAFELSGLALMAVCVVFFFSPPPWPIWGYGLVLGGCFVVFLLAFRWSAPPFKCPGCGRVLRRANRKGFDEGEPIRFVCKGCDIEWDTGFHVPDG